MNNLVAERVRLLQYMHAGRFSQSADGFHGEGLRMYYRGSGLIGGYYA